MESEGYLVCIPRLTSPKEFLNDDNDSKLIVLGGRLLKRLKRTEEPNQTDNESRCKRDEKCFPQIWDCVYAVGFH